MSTSTDTCAGVARATGKRCLSRDLVFVDSEGNRFCVHHKTDQAQPIVVASEVQRDPEILSGGTESPRETTSADQEIPAGGLESPQEATNADGTPRVPHRQTCAGTSKNGEPCMRIVLSHEFEERLYCSSHAPAGAILLKWDPTRMPICEGLLADGKNRCTRSVLEHVSVGPGVERGLCRKHLDNWATRQTLILPRAEKKSRKMPAFVTPIEDAEEEPVVETAPLAKRERPADLRAALEETAAESYWEIEQSLREAIRSARKMTKVNCPRCSHIFSVQVRDWGNVIRASSELLDRVVSRPTPSPAAEVTIDDSLTPEDVKNLSTKELMHLLAVHGKPSPGGIMLEDLQAQIRETKDTLALAREGHDLSERRITLAQERAKHYATLAMLFSEFVGADVGVRQ